MILKGGVESVKNHALVAMSGGVDSSVALWLTIKSGFSCQGAYMQMCSAALLGKAPGKDAEDAAAVAKRLDIPFCVLDGTAAFIDHVAEPFVAAYEAGLTPNPCIACNKTMKFGLLLQKALENGCDTLVTGHYARICRDEKTGRYLLKKAADENKDQSYFLACLDQQQLSHVFLPLGELTKEQVRAIAEDQGFINARKRDSQDICFIPDGDHVGFMERYRGKPYPAGNYLDLNGKVVGQHKGAAGYTIGQRKGLGIALGQPAYVCAKDMKNNTVTLGSNEDLFKSVLRAKDWNWFPFPALEQPIRVLAKVRYRHIPQWATVYPEKDGFARVEFDQPQRAITAGQAVVLYDGDTVVGGGTITETI